MFYLKISKDAILIAGVDSWCLYELINLIYTIVSLFFFALQSVLILTRFASAGHIYYQTCKSYFIFWEEKLNHLFCMCLFFYTYHRNKESSSFPLKKKNYKCISAFWKKKHRLCFLFHHCVWTAIVFSCCRLCGMCGPRGLCENLWSRGGMYQYCFS